MSALDAEDVDIFPLVSRAAEQRGIPIVGLLAMLKAESGLRRTAERWGDRSRDAVEHIGDVDYLRGLLADLRRRGIGLDVSFGYSQLIVSTAGGYGIGDGSMSVDNVLAVREALFDRTMSIDVGARHLSGCYSQADGYDEQDLQALLAYNSGSPQPQGNWYWQRWAGNIASYEAALQWARELLAV
ncbi:MAG: transglycosylase SLT domain-containing protein [Dehalococcoidales bacterium]|nr:transglycosylase SLT domain-containing protein [Dehalococcoidales bacterium]